MATYREIAERVGGDATVSDWEEAWAFLPGPPVTDVDDVLGGYAHSDEGYAQVDMVLVARLRDGTYLAVEAGCDTTGWDCRGDAKARFAPTLDRLWERCLTVEQRARLDPAELRRRDGASLTGMIHERRRHTRGGHT